MTEQPAQRLILVDTVAAAQAVGTHPRNIRKWAHRGKLHPHGKDDKGRTLYALRDVYIVQQQQTHRLARIDTGR